MEKEGERKKMKLDRARTGGRDRREYLNRDHLNTISMYYIRMFLIQSKIREILQVNLLSMNVFQIV